MSVSSLLWDDMGHTQALEQSVLIHKLMLQATLGHLTEAHLDHRSASLPAFMFLVFNPEGAEQKLCPNKMRKVLHLVLLLPLASYRLTVSTFPFRNHQ